MAPPPLFRRLFFCPFAHGKAAQEDWIFFRIGLYSNLYGQTDEEILTFLFRSTFFLLCVFFDSFPFKSKGRRHAPVQGVAALPVSPVTETERSFSCVLLLFPPRVIQT